MSIFLHILLIIISLFLMFIGFLGEVLPGPGAILILVTAFVYAVIDGFHHIGWLTLVALSLLWLLSVAFHYLTAIITIKKLGVSWAGVIGTIVGSILGLIFFGILGGFIGMIIGAFIAEFIWLRRAKKALKAGAGALLGIIFGTALKLFFAGSMILIFIIALIF